MFKTWCTGVMKFLFWKKCLYTYILIHGGIFWPHWIPGDPKVAEYSILSKMCDTIEFILKKYLEVQIFCICGLFFSEMRIFLPFLTPTWSLGLTKKVGKLWYVINKWQHRTFHEEYLSVCENFLFFWNCFSKVGSFLFFIFFFCLPGCPKKGQNL